MNLAEKIQFHRDEDLRFSRLAMAHRLRARRLLAHTDTIERRTRFAQTIKGSGVLAAEFLGINPNAFYNRLWNYKQAVVLASVVLAFLISSFNLPAQTKGAQLLLRSTFNAQRPTPNIQPLPALPAAPALTNRGATFTLAVDSFVGTLRLYASTNKTDWRLVCESTQRTNVITGIFLPQYFRAVSYLGEEESEPSNQVGLLGYATDLKIIGMASPDLNTWNDYGVIFEATGLEDSVAGQMQFFKQRVEKTRRLKVE